MDDARTVFARLAAVTGGMLLPFDANAPDRVRALLEAMAARQVRGGARSLRAPGRTALASASSRSSARWSGTHDHVYFLFLYNPIQLFAVNKAVEFVPHVTTLLKLVGIGVTEEHWSVRKQKIAGQE